MRITFQLLLLALALSFVCGDKNDDDKGQKTKLSDEAVHVAYDDGLEPDEADEETSAHTRGLDATLVRSLVGITKGDAKSKDDLPFSVIKTAGLLGQDSIDALQALASKFERDLNSRRKKKVGTLRASKDLPSTTQNDKEGKVSSPAKHDAEVKGKSTPSPVVDIPAVVRDAFKKESFVSKNARSTEITLTDKAVDLKNPSLQKTEKSEKLEKLAPVTFVSSGETIQIGSNTFPAERVTIIGDIDANGYKDYVVGSPKEKSNCGAVRVYLMKTNNKIKAERHVIPGKWGFFHKSLTKGDMFGSSVLPIGDVNRDGVDDIAIGAPGDKESGTAKGAVYILLMKKDGSVKHTQKISATSDLSLGRQLQPDEGFGANLTRIADINGDEVPEVSVGSIDGSSTLLFLSKEGTAHASIKFHGQTSITDLISAVRPSRSSGTKVGGKGLNFSARAVSDTCYFTDTHCQCETTGKSTAKCLDVVETLKDSRMKCEERDCKPSFKCSCGGESLCTRASVQKNVYKADESAGGNLFYCSMKKIQNEDVKLMPGASVPEAAASGSSNVGVWSDTKCACSPKASLGKGPGVCAEFEHKTGNQSFCNVRQCAESTDMQCDIVGKSICSRAFESKEKYASDGESDGSHGEADGFHKCHLAKEQVEVAKCIEKCP